MPLHDWTNRTGWEGMHHLWITELLRWVKPRLPVGYRAYIGSAPMLAVGAPSGKPDVGVHSWPDTSGEPSEPSASAVLPEGAQIEPDEELAVATLDPGSALFVESQGRLIAALEVISPRNKDRPIAREAYRARYLGYLLEAVHLLLIDVHPRPVGFSFADRLAEDLGLEPVPCPPPMASSYRVGEPAPTGGRLLAIWRRALALGEPLPTLPLPITVDQSIAIDLETTYAAAAADAYLS